MRPLLVASVLTTVLFNSQAESETLSPSHIQVRSGSVDAQADRTNAAGNIGTAVQKGATSVQDRALVTAAKAQIQKIWPEITSVYPFLGDRGLLIEVRVAVNDASASKPVPQKQIQDVAVVGVGVDPAHAWAENLRDTLHPAATGYTLSPADSWFVWIRPGRDGWPKLIPTYKRADALGLLDRREPRASVVAAGITIRSNLLANEGLLLDARMNAIAAVAKAAQNSADTAALREAAVRLQNDAASAAQKLAEINERLDHDLKAIARAQNALLILDGTIAISNAAMRIGDALGLLGPDAPPAPLAGGMTEADARKYINDLVDRSKKSTIEMREQQTIIIRDVDGKVEGFKQHFKGSVTAFPPH
jgi:hypothetical protein